MNSWDLMTEDYEPTREELEAEGLLKMWCDCIESGHHGFAAWLPKDCIMRANAEERKRLARLWQAQQMMGIKPVWPGMVGMK